MKITAMTTMALMAATSAFAEETAPIREALNDLRVVAAMRTAWMQSENGTTGVEATFRLDRRASDYKVVAAPRTNEVMQQKVSVVPGVTFALFHVHPTRGEPAPSPQDRAIADKYQLKIFTMHACGLYEYDPVTRKITQLRDGLSWTNPVQN